MLRWKLQGVSHAWFTSFMLPLAHASHFSCLLIMILIPSWPLFAHIWLSLVNILEAWLVLISFKFILASFPPNFHTPKVTIYIHFYMKEYKNNFLISKYFWKINYNFQSFIYWKLVRILFVHVLVKKLGGSSQN